jgi:septal ring factor EnvC (AmiA/AmiB activator)
MKIDMNMKFEREIMAKKEIYECDMRNEDLAFKLFSKQLFLTKNKNKAVQGALSGVEAEISKIKEEIEANTSKKTQLNRQLQEMEEQRNKMLGEYQQELL